MAMELTILTIALYSFNNKESKMENTCNQNIKVEE